MPSARALLALLLLLMPGTALAAERSFMVGAFERLRIEGPFEVELATGTTPRARAEGDRRALEALDVHLNGTTLVVRRSVDRPEGGGPVVLRLVTPVLRAALVNGGARLTMRDIGGRQVDLSVNGAGMLDARGIAADQLNVALVGTGAIRLAGKAARARYRTNGAGSIDAQALEAGDVTLFSESAGDTHVAARYSAQVVASGIGRVTIDGKGDCRVSGPGPVACGGRLTRR